MKLKTNYPITSREAFAKELSYFISWRGFWPYKPNGNDDSFWIIDEGNNWKVKFHSCKSNSDKFHSDKSLAGDNVFELVYRYDNRIMGFAKNLEDYEPHKAPEIPSEILSKWVAWLYGYEIIQD